MSHENLFYNCQDFFPYQFYVQLLFNFFFFKYFVLWGSICYADKYARSKIASYKYHPPHL